MASQPRKLAMKTMPGSKILERIRAIVDDLPEMAEVEAWGHPTFRAGKKMFAGYGEDKVEGAILGMNVGFERQEELLRDAKFFPTPYAAHRGWVSMRLDAKTNWQQVKGLLHEAYRHVANKRMLQTLDQR
ncbi:MAG: MmcQ/YjbR family DNA-binding protein [Gemmataceae bacterium]